VRPVPDPNNPDYVDDPNNYIKNGYAEIKNPDEGATVGPLPAMKVIVRAEAHDRFGPLAAHMAISAVEKEFQLEFDENHVSFNLGDYELKLTSEDPLVVEKVGLTSSAGQSTYERNIVIKANLSIVGDSVTPAGSKEINFNLVNPPSDTYLLSTSAITDDNGDCEVTLNTIVPNSEIEVEGVFKTEWIDSLGNSIVKEYKDQITINPNIKRIIEVTSDNHLVNIPDFECKYFENGTTETIVRATLKEIEITTPMHETLINDETLKFSVEDPHSILSPTTSITGAGGVEGEAIITFTTTDLTHRDIEVTVEGDNTTDPYTVLPEPQVYIVKVTDNLLFKEDFEKAEYDTSLKGYELQSVLSANGWGLSLPTEHPYDEATGQPILDETVSDLSSFYSPGANGTGKSIKLYSNHYTPAYYRQYTGPFPPAQINRGIPGNTSSGYEIRFFIRNGEENIHWMNIGSYGAYRYRSRIASSSSLITFYAHGLDDREVWNAKNEFISSYSTEWMNFRIQIIPASDSRPARIVYLLDGYEINDINRTKEKSIKGAVFEFIGHGGTIWYDEIEVYSFEGLPELEP
ncbi:hypothetical protein KKB18_06910, partial [bacterium]|nr:hypothetical protein [bacterium]